jgi:hypothetical protein
MLRSNSKTHSTRAHHARGFEVVDDISDRTADEGKPQDHDLMIAGLDSSFDRPTPAQAAAAFAAGVRLWGGYIGTRGGLGLASLWSQAEFQVVKDAGMTAIAYCSGFDDPAGVRAMAAAWGVLLGVDVEPGIRDDGPWVPGFLQATGAGLYGLASVHYDTGEPIGRGAAWNVIANYPGFDPGVTWVDGLTPPAAPHGRQWEGTHTEFGLSVDRMWLDDSFTTGELNMAQLDDIQQTVSDINTRTALLYNALFFGNSGENPPKPLVQAQATADGIAKIEQMISNLQVPPASLQPVLDAIAGLKADLDSLTLKKV